MNDEQRALLGKAKRALRTAKIALADGDADAAASRAYYAMFYVAEAYLAGEGLDLSSHAGVRGAFGKHFAKTGRVPPEFHHYLIGAAELRRVADYRTAPIADGDAAEAISQAERFIELADSQL